MSRPGAGIAGVLLVTFGIAGCVGPISLHEAVLGYDRTVSRLEEELLLVNIARLRALVPVHFTVASSIAATFDYQTNAGVTVGGVFASGSGPSSDVSFSLGASAAENPTMTIVPIQGREFTERILTPLDDSKLDFLVFQGAPLEMVMRLMVDGIEVQTREGAFGRFILNWPSRPEEYEQFRRIAMRLAWLNDNRRLFVGRLSFLETSRVRLGAPPDAGEVRNALEKAFSWRPLAENGVYALERRVTGRVVITNYDPRTLSNAERQALNARAGANPGNFVLVDIRPDRPGGDVPMFGALKLRSLHMILNFVAADHGGSAEFDVAPDPRTGDGGPNPRQTLAIEVGDQPPPGDLPAAQYGDQYYSVANTRWDREAFGLLYRLYQMTVTDVSGVGTPITISK